MKVGLLLSGHQPVAEIARLSRLAEALAFQSVWISDERFLREVYVLLAAVGVSTERILLGPCVTDPFSRHPAMSATAIATLDDLSRGRMILGFGAGISGFAEMGVERKRPVAAMREAIDLMRQMWSGAIVDYVGGTTQFRSGKLGFAPVRAEIPIYVAANGLQSQSMAAAVADAVVMEGCASLAEAEAFVQRVRTAAVAAGRHPSAVSCVARLNVAVATDRAIALEIMRLRVARMLGAGRVQFYTHERQGLTLPQEASKSVRGLPYTATPEKYKPIAEFVTDKMIRAVCLAGTPADIREHAVGLARVGIEGLILSPFTVAGQTYDEALETLAQSLGTTKEGGGPTWPS